MAPSLTVETYKLRQAELRAEELSRGRDFCRACLQPHYGCYCAELRAFDPKMRFIVLIHPLEARRRIATGRMSHLSLENSTLVRGQDFSEDAAVERLVNDPKLHCVVLYPVAPSTNLSTLEPAQRDALFPADKELAIIVLDGTWWTARKMARSRNLANLPRVCFSPRAPSRFRVRKQPSPECCSTIEAIHETIELLGRGRGFDVDGRAHDALLDVFDSMVERQLKCVHKIRSRRHKSPAERA